MSLGSAVLRIRHERNLTQGQVGQRAGIAASYLSRIENDHVQPTMGTLGRLAKALGVPMSSIFQVSERGPESFKHTCPVSTSGKCIGEQIRSTHGRRPLGRRASYGKEELRLLKMADYVVLNGTKPVRQALTVLLESLIEKTGGSPD